MTGRSAAVLQDLRILLIIGGGIAACKIPALIRLLKTSGAQVQPVLTQSARQFVTPLTIETLCAQRVYTDIFPTTEHWGAGSGSSSPEIDHLQLSRQSDLLLVAPATAHLLARMALGLADDLATNLLLAAGDRRICVAPAMNTRMWEHPATQAHVACLRARGIRFLDPEEGFLAEGEYGIGRMVEPERILEVVIEERKRSASRPLSGRSALVTSGPTQEPMDPLRYVSNRSSGVQGHAVASALADLGAEVTLVTGPVAIPAPDNVRVLSVITAQEMWTAVHSCSPVDIFVGVAAVSDWRVADLATEKRKKSGTGELQVKFLENPDILASVSKDWVPRPHLVVGFSAETEDVVARAQQKRLYKGCDWMVANDVSLLGGGVPGGAMGSAENQITLVTEQGVEEWPRMSKIEVARLLADRIALSFSESSQTENDSLFEREERISTEF